MGPPKQRAVLAALAYSVGQPVPVSVLIERVWCDSPPAEARTSIQAYVTRLRRLTGPERPIDIARAGDGYQLNLPWPDVDVNRTRHLARQARSSLEIGDRLHRHPADHLGVEPGPELRRLHQALLQPKPDPGR
ncbi:winged helix-turn-helix domain-containing protein [Actinoplanes campanulatus]|uniref:winged helix-turn-helix domain-containing protein n=1 Tax=Actinoplanes campanulatus TaxID=113559 RepID=UPI001997AE0E|nr:winged helix-turn-helix domain-containing protein [Actinoplanes campanulatus]GGN46083.1 hypothetical protein GCM10010109_80920 [Actinoplanes campanulatus]GID41200.1 hypothetical protein Aca09nite_77060 [Actinoplanes campanulatus]